MQNRNVVLNPNIWYMYSLCEIEEHTSHVILSGQSVNYCNIPQNDNEILERSCDFLKLCHLARTTARSFVQQRALYYMKPISDLMSNAFHAGLGEVTINQDHP